MVVVILIVVGIFLLNWVGGLPTNLQAYNKKTLSESKIVKRFNKALKSLGERSIDAVKQELIECLDEYTIVKEKQFAFTLAQIRKAQNDIEAQKSQIKNRVYETEAKLHRFASSHPGDTSSEILNEGAKLMHNYKLSKILFDKLQIARESLDNRESELNSMLTDFNSNVAIKKAEISIMIADSTGVFSGSTIDLRLDSLVKEFQDKVIEGKATQDVHDKLNNEKSVIDYSECRKEFEELITTK